MRDRYIDPNGTVWIPPTAEAYALTCAALHAAEKALAALKDGMEKVATVEGTIHLAIVDADKLAAMEKALAEAREQVKAWEQKHRDMFGCVWEDAARRAEAALLAMTKERDEAREISENCCKPAMEGLLKTEAALSASQEREARLREALAPVIRWLNERIYPCYGRSGEGDADYIDKTKPERDHFIGNGIFLDEIHALAIALDALALSPSPASVEKPKMCPECGGSGVKVIQRRGSGGSDIPFTPCPKCAALPSEAGKEAPR